MKSGRLFIDADPTAFGLVLERIGFKKFPSHIRKSVGELETIRSLADFLCFEPLVAYLDDVIASLSRLRIW